MGEEQFFVGINNHLDIRRNLLECSREMIQSMQSYEKLTRIRDIKIKRIKQFIWNGVVDTIRNDEIMIIICLIVYMCKKNY